MATYVLVHGGGHGGWGYKVVATRLRAKGHEVYTPTLTGLGDRAHQFRPDIGLNDHVADIVALIEAEELSDLVLVGHSYAGMVISGVAEPSAAKCWANRPSLRAKVRKSTRVPSGPLAQSSRMLAFPWSESRSPIAGPRRGS